MSAEKLTTQAELFDHDIIISRNDCLTAVVHRKYGKLNKSARNIVCRDAIGKRWDDIKRTLTTRPKTLDRVHRYMKEHD